jgi:phosphoenolpyruvate---glycerone phosphotransferase subunit DhaL
MSERVTAADIEAAVRRIHARVDTLRDELNAADRALGDGDTGMTIANVVGAWMNALPPAVDDVGALLLQLGRETRRASGSSLGSVLAIGLTAAGKAAPASPDRDAVVALLGAAADAITERSGASAGDKTILDSLLAVRDAVDSGRSAVDGAAAALETFRGREARMGRARIYGAKSVGQDDPGMLAAVLLLRAAREDG